MKFTEPDDKAIPDPTQGDKEWCLFKFIEDDLADERPLMMNLKSCFLFGSDPEICDFNLIDEKLDAPDQAMISL